MKKMILAAAIAATVFCNINNGLQFVDKNLIHIRIEADNEYYGGAAVHYWVKGVTSCHTTSLGYLKHQIATGNWEEILE
jgi:hypothetical protein